METVRVRTMHPHVRATLLLAAFLVLGLITQVHGTSITDSDAEEELEGVHFEKLRESNVTEYYSGGSGKESVLLCKFQTNHLVAPIQLEQWRLCLSAAESFVGAGP